MNDIKDTNLGNTLTGAVGPTGSSSDIFSYTTNSIYTANTATPYQHSYGNITISNNTWGSSGSGIFSTASNPSTLQVKGDAEFEGKVMINGRDMARLFEKIEDRLAILAEPDPEKLEKFAALKKAYDNYKLLEKLIGDDYKNDTDKS